MSYGYCPYCGAEAVRRARNPVGPTTCVNGHNFPHADTLSAKQADDLKGVEPGWLKKSIDAAHESIEGPERIKRSYATLRVALRNAILRVCSPELPDKEVSQVFRNIEAGMSISDATDALEVVLTSVVLTDRIRRSGPS